MSGSPAEGCRVSASEDSGMLSDLVVSRLYTAVVSDILDDPGHRDHALDPAAGRLRRFGVL
jgi:hypothetical protein